jgi:hypothetical protein
MSTYKLKKKECVDELVSQFHRNGYLTLQRKYGKYLPEPEPVGVYNVDAIGKYKRKYVLGITLEEKDFEDPKLIRKLTFLASRRSKYSQTKVTLFVGVPEDLMPKFKEILWQIDELTRKNIKPVTISLNKRNDYWSKNSPA